MASEADYIISPEEAADLRSSLDQIENFQQKI